MLPDTAMDPNMMLLAAMEDDDDLLMALNVRDREVGNKNQWRLNFQKLENEECKFMFRFEKDDILRLKNALRFPTNFTCSNGTIVSAQEALCIVLRRLAYPNRLGDLTPIFGRSKEEISMIVNVAIDDIYENYGHLLIDLNQQWLSRDNLRMFADAIHQKGAPLTKCWGFIDGTVRPICRPSTLQREVYSGHKRVHGLKFQSVQAPNGIIANMLGPMEGRRHDAAMLAESGLLNQLQDLVDIDGEAFYLYGDPCSLSTQATITFTLQRSKSDTSRKKFQQKHEFCARMC